ncbi:MAG: hypothetical protein K0S41_1349 [Anaerocolumna sp.]|jgi:AraC-like DNA-binding protein|nr:hypothetical protein [Anaerocolumna sp.]
MIKSLDGIFEKVDYEKNSSVLLYVNKEYENYPIHWHTAMEIIMPLENDYKVVISKNAYHLNPNDILIIPPGELHELFAPRTGRRIIFQFDFAIISNLKGFTGIFPILLQPRLLTPENSEDIHTELMNLLLRIKEEYIQNDNLSEAAIYSKIIQIFVYTARKYMNTGNLFPDVKLSKQKEYIEKFNIIFDYINENLTEDITLDKIADVAGFSKFHFSRLFKQFTNMSFYDYLNQKRVKSAESLLLNPNNSITDVAMKSGFSSISTFNRVFKTVKECTPTEFKNLYFYKGVV